RARAADVLGVAQKFAHAFQLRAGADPLARREAGHQHRAREFLALADPDAPVVEGGAAAAAGGEQFVAQRVEHDAVLWLAVLHQRDRDAPVRPAVQVVAGAVERVDDPGRLRRQRRAAPLLRTAFLAEARVFRVGPAQFLDHRLLGEAVDLAGVVHAVLLDDVERVELVHVPKQDAAARAGRLDHDVDDGLEHGGNGLWAGTGEPQSLPLADGPLG